MKSLVEKLTKKKLKISFAESCTGGMLASSITSISGASKVFDLVDLTKGILNQQESQTPSNDVVDLSCLSGDNLHEETSCSQTISKEIDGTTVDNNQANTERVKPNFKKLYYEYLVKWRMNPPPNETRPMRLSELIWSNCDGSSNQLDVDYGSDDSKDVFLKSALFPPSYNH